MPNIEDDGPIAVTGFPMDWDALGNNSGSKISPNRSSGNRPINPTTMGAIVIGRIINEVNSRVLRFPSQQTSNNEPKMICTGITNIIMMPVTFKAFPKSGSVNALA